MNWYDNTFGASGCEAHRRPYPFGLQLCGDE